MRKDIEKYELSDDRLGLIAYCKTVEGKKFTYHIHKNELNTIEKWIKKLIKSDKRMNGMRIMNANADDYWKNKKEKVK